MNPEIQPLIDTVKGLPFLHQLEILKEITKSMAVQWNQSGDGENDFWHPKTIEAHLKANPVKAVDDMDAPAVDFWPEDENVDDFIHYTYGQRRKDRLEG